MFIAINRRLREDEGFTLIELLVVVIIIGILAAIAIPTFLRQRERGWAASAESDARNAAINVETIYTQNPAAGYTTGSAVGGSAGTGSLVDFKGSTNVTTTVFVSGGSPATAYCVRSVHASLGADDTVYLSSNGLLTRTATPPANCS